MKKIVILTLPFNDNYGGIIQSAALQFALKKMGIDSCTFKYVPRGLPFMSACGWLLYFFKNRYMPFKFLARKMAARAYYFRSFMRCNLRETPLCLMPSRRAALYGNAWIVGSDQVWRGWGGKLFYFLNFLPSAIREKSFSYAASFGRADYVVNENEVSELQRLAGSLKSISVREASAVELCRKYLNVDAEVMPDPTLLLQTADYESMIHSTIDDYPKDYQGNFIAYYILDMTSEKWQYLQHLSKERGLPLVDMSSNLLLDSSGVLKRPIEQWLDIVSKALYLITDSFHGCVFAIIFNKSFVCLGNENRGNTRFYSLLKTYRLQNRLVTNQDVDTILQTLNATIDWESVNSIREHNRVRGINFLDKNMIARYAKSNNE